VRAKTLADLPRRRTLGAYYTPWVIAESLVQWAVRAPSAHVLDPSCGDGVFLRAATARLGLLGAERPTEAVHGVDVDAEAVAAIRTTPSLLGVRVLHKDFLSTPPKELGRRFDAIVGNPPYVRHHWQDSSVQAAVRYDRPLGLSGRSSLWAYFLARSLNHLEPAGRLALVLPRALLQADYAARVQEQLQRRFRNVWVVELRERIFEGTDETIVVLLAEGTGPGSLRHLRCRTSEDLSEQVRLLGAGDSSETALQDSPVSSATRELLRRLKRELPTLGDLASVRIGIVTGANAHFIRSRQELDDLGVNAQDRHPIIGRTSWLHGLEFRRSDHLKEVHRGGRTHLVRPRRDQEEDATIRRWIEEGTRQKLDQRFKCRIREPWHRVPLQSPPSAFATCSRQSPPLLVLNTARYRCTNALHGIRWRRPLSDHEIQAIAVGFMTPATALFAELTGRQYGGGVLKMEPSALARLPVPVVPGAAAAFAAVDRELRAGNEDEARRVAGRAVLVDGLGLDKGDVDRLEAAQRELAAERVPFRPESEVDRDS